MAAGISPSAPNTYDCTNDCQDCGDDTTSDTNGVGDTDDTCNGATDELPPSSDDGGGASTPDSYTNKCGDNIPVGLTCDSDSEQLIQAKKKGINVMNKARKKVGLKPIANLSSDSSDDYTNCMKNIPNYAANCTVDGSIELDQYMSAQIDSSQENSVRTTIQNELSTTLTQTIQDNLGDFQINDSYKQQIDSITCTATFLITCDSNWTKILLSQCQDLTICGSVTGTVLLDSVQETILDILQNNQTLQDMLDDITEDVSQDTTLSGFNWSALVITIVAVFFCLIIIAVIVWLWKKYYKKSS